MISNVSYDLTFTIPAGLDTRVAGRAIIKFDLANASRPLVLDFSAPAGSVLDVSVRGAAVPFEIQHDHVVIPQTALEAGPQELTIDFLATDGALNRHRDFLYTLFVPDRASSAFPCFDQPDLKARYRLTLRIPNGWKAVSNGSLEREGVANGQTELVFRETAPLSTYLFAFAAGEFAVETGERDGRIVRVFHRETDSIKVARNRDTIFGLHAAALRWLEDYTGIPYPFEKFDLIAIPSFQFGGMEHPGAVFYRAGHLFLDESATQNRRLGRASVIAHETAHMWFGDLVTMQWFNDVWMKEVFANFMAAKIVEPAFPTIDHDLRFFVAHHPGAYAVDRTAGANPIRQELENLRQAGTLYGAIIYQKAPIVMLQLERLIGETVMREGLGAYLRQFQFGNATWPDLVTILDDLTAEDLASWSRVWVEEPGRPRIVARADQGDLRVEQSDPWGQDRRWNQRTQVTLASPDSAYTVTVHLRDAVNHVQGATEPLAPTLVFPGSDGVSYGRFALDKTSTTYLLAHLPELANPMMRSVAWMSLWETLLEGDILPDSLLELALRALTMEGDELIVQQILGLTQTAFWRFLDADARMAAAGRVESVLWERLERASTPSLKAAYFDALMSVTSSGAGIERLESIWRTQQAPPGLPLAERDYTTLAEALAIRDPDRATGILEAQASRIENPDRAARFRFIMPAFSPDRSVRDSVFESFANPRNRERERWVLDAVSVLHHPLRSRNAEAYILESLELLEEIQRTGDIFFPLRWLHATLDGHQSIDAARIVVDFLEKHPDYPSRLRGKILQAADELFRAARIVEEWSGGDGFLRE